MSATNGNGKGNLLITYLFKNNSSTEQIDEERQLKNEIAQLLNSKGYKFVVANDELINKKLLKS